MIVNNNDRFTAIMSETTKDLNYKLSQIYSGSKYPK